MSWAAAATAAGSVASGLLGKKKGGGSAEAAAPISTTISMGPATFGGHFLGTDAIKAAPAIGDAQAGSAARWIPWVVGGVVALVLGALFLRRPRAK